MMLRENTEEGLIISFLSMVAPVREVLEEGAAYVLGKRVNKTHSKLTLDNKEAKLFATKIQLCSYSAAKQEF